MYSLSKKEERFVEAFLIALVLGIVCLFFTMTGYKLVVLYLFYLPVVLAGFFLGRYRAGILAFLCVTAISIVAALTIDVLPANVTPVLVGLAILVWAGTLGLTSLLVGTLSDERRHATKELHEAYVGVVEVLSQYLQSGNPVLKARSVRVAELCQTIAVELALSPKHVDDIRVAALLHEMGNVEVTTKVIRRAIAELEPDVQFDPQHTFQGRDLVFSISSVLSGATPLVLELQNSLCDYPDATRSQSEHPEASLSGRIIFLVRAYVALTHATSGGRSLSPEEATDELSMHAKSGYDQQVLKALRNCVLHAQRSAPKEPQQTANPAPALRSWTSP